ncbi:MAG TPA: hypothetical protein VER79_03430 [Candidatus Limnocylindrales bacterium]|nr:hypothetical protein [Candidatus Limnocylindrales bacterium]
MHPVSRAFLGLSAVVILLLAACQPVPTQRFALGEVLQHVTFEADYEWENYANAEQKVAFGVEDGEYHARAWDGGFTWAMNAELHTDVVIQADVRQLSEYTNNAFGLMCRAAPTNNGNGYFFFISGDGTFTIRRGAASEVDYLIPWTHTNTIQQGRSINRLRIVCIEDYLALYVNGQFVAETRDSRYLQGYAGITAAVPEGGDVDVLFDDLTIWSASLIRAQDEAAAEPSSTAG